MNHRHLRKPFRHAQPHRGMPRRLTRFPLLSAAAIGAASMVALTVGGQPGGASPAAHAPGAAVLDLSAAGYGAASAGQATGTGGLGADPAPAGGASAVAGVRPAPAATNPFGVRTPGTPAGGAQAGSGALASSGAQAGSAAQAGSVNPDNPDNPATPGAPTAREARAGFGAAAAAAAAKPVTPSAGASAAPTTPAAPAAPKDLELYYQHRWQINGYYCGPAATRMAISSRGHYPSQDTLARQLGTTMAGTNSVVDITRVLNAVNKNSFYHPTTLPAKPATTQQRSQLQADVVRAMSEGYPVVMNIVGTGRDVNGNQRTFSGGHYVTAVGYKDRGRLVKIGDSADPYGGGSYWMSLGDLANWAGNRGYAS
jgi:Peptidase_C39 like family